MQAANKAGIALVSAALIGAVTQLEGTRYVPYEDIIGVWTVCEGYAQADVVRGKTYTRAECDALTGKQLAEKGAAVLRCTNVALKQREYDAYTLFTYNVGAEAFCHASLLKKLNAGDHVGACNGLLAWDMAGGRHVPGLAKRRAFERDMCLASLTTTP